MWFSQQTKNNNIRILFILAILAVLLLPILLPLSRNGFFVSDDGEWMIIRLSAFYEVLRDGQVPARFLQRLNQGFGYPVANFLYPGFLYLGVPIHVLGFSFTSSIKILMAGSFLASSYFMFFWLRKFFNDVSSLVGSLFYSYAPYHVYDLYTRGSVGELLALAILPFILWQLERRSAFLAMLGIGLLLISHNTLAIFFLGVLVLVSILDICVAKDRKEALLWYLPVFIIGTGLAAFFWVPALFDLQFTIFSETEIGNWREYFSDLRLVGMQTYLIFTASLAVFFLHRVRPSKHRLTLLLLFVGLVSTFLATPMSAFLWEILPVSFVQFPFRFLSVSIVSASFLIAFLFSVFKKTEQVIGGVLVVLLATFSLWPVLTGIQYIDKPDSYYSTNLDTTTVHQEYMPRWVKEIPEKWENKKVVTYQGKVDEIATTANSISFQSNGSGEYVIQKVYFPGWHATIDGRSIPISYENPKGLISLMLPEGSHRVELRFSETPLHLVSDVISVFSLAIVLTIGIRRLGFPLNIP
ncbi:MAG: hypothetical protein HYV40_05670 [Candidatus Levybacteria bacterium]|nr:hypothetical protein [Candidatus Levybacteria bacterium]